MASNIPKIERGIPMPNNSKGARKFPFAEMEVGDSFAAPSDKITSARQSAVAFGKYHGIKFSCRKQEDGSIRIWRVA